MNIILDIIVLGMIAAALWNMSLASRWYMGLYLAHDILFSHLADNVDTVQEYAAWACMFASLSMIVCLHLIKDIYEDTVPFRLACISGLMGLAGVLTIYLYANYKVYEMMTASLGFDILNPIFVGLGLASIAAMIAGGKGELDNTRVLYRHSTAYRIASAVPDKASRHSHTAENGS